MDRLAKRLMKIAEEVAGSQATNSSSYEFANEALGDLRSFIHDNLGKFYAILNVAKADGDSSAEDGEFQKYVNNTSAALSRSNVKDILDSVSGLKAWAGEMTKRLLSDGMNGHYDENEIIKLDSLLDDFMNIAEEAEDALNAYAEAHFYRVWLSHFNSIDVEAGNAEEALEGAVAKAEKEGWFGLLEDPESVMAEASENGWINENGEESPEFEERYAYVDATADGASHPWYVNGLELNIEPIG